MWRPRRGVASKTNAVASAVTAVEKGGSRDLLDETLGGVESASDDLTVVQQAAVVARNVEEVVEALEFAHEFPIAGRQMALDGNPIRIDRFGQFLPRDASSAERLVNGLQHG